MLNFSSGKPGLDRAVVVDGETNDPGIDFVKLLRAARRQLWIVLLFCCLGVASGAAYLLHAIPRYTATTVVVIDSAKDKSGLAATLADLTFDSSAIDSQLEVLKSENVARAVITNLKLDQQTSLPPPKNFISSFISRWFLPPSTSPAEQSKEVQDRKLIDELQSNLEVRRVGRSYVINVDYTSADPVNAARISTAFAEAYIGDQLESRSNTMRRAGSWLEEKIADLKEKALASDLEILRFKASQELLTAENKPIVDQQLSELSSQLVTAKSELARAEARYDQIRKLMNTNSIPAVVSDTLSNPVIIDLRKRYLEAASTEAELSNNLGSEHFQAQKLRRTMYEISVLILNEMSRIATSYQSDVEVARARETSLERSLTALAAKNNASNEAMVRLRQMQRESENYKTFYASFVQRLQQVQEMQSLPGSDARIITPASPPTHPSFPKRTLSMALFLFSGGLIGIALGALREARDNVFRRAADVREGLGMEFLGMLPTIQSATPRRFGPFAGTSRRLTTIFPNLRTARQSVPTYASRDVNHGGLGIPGRSVALAAPEAAEIETPDPTLTYVVDNPNTSFAETLRGTKVVIDSYLSSRPIKVIGFVSMSAGEGKSTVSKNFASLVASLGARVLLIDGDMHRAGLTKKMANKVRVGLVDVIRGDRTLDEAVMFEKSSNLRFLPAVVDHGMANSNHLLIAAGMRRLLEQATGQFDYVVVDLPPIGPSVDVRAASSFFDCFVLVVNWGHTLRQLVQTSMDTEKEIADRCVGVIYNNVQLNRIQLYEGPSERDYYHREYAKYY
jgi:succinoglycan biosynthesis transport protein ExoP